MAVLTTIGIYGYNDKLFDDLQLPSGIDKSNFIDNLLMEVDVFEVLYTDPFLMQRAIGAWSSRRLKYWNRFLETENYNYDPLSNLKRTDTIDSGTKKKNNSTGETLRNLFGTDKLDRTSENSLESSTPETTTSQNSGADTQNNFVVAYNEYTENLATKQTNELGSKNTTTVQKTNTQDESGTLYDDRSTSDTGTIKDTKEEVGEIDTAIKKSYVGTNGKFSQQELIQQQRYLLEYDTIKIIIDEYIDRFCILVY